MIPLDEYENIRAPLATRIRELEEQLEALEKNRDLWRRRAEFYGELHDANVLAKWIADEESSPASGERVAAGESSSTSAQGAKQSPEPSPATSPEKTDGYKQARGVIRRAVPDPASSPKEGA